MKKILIFTMILLIALSSLVLAQQRLDYNGYIRSAKIYLGQTPKDYTRAAEKCEDAIKYYPNKPPLKAHYILGTIYYDNRLYEEMVTEFNYVLSVCDTTSSKKVKKNCRKEDFVSNINSVLEAGWRNQYNEGVSYLQQARESDSSCASLTVEEEKLSCDSSTQEYYNKASEYFRLSTIMIPDSSQGWVNLGIIYFSNGETEKALEYYRKAIEINPNDLALLSNLSSMYFNLQEYDSAVYYFNRMLDQDDLDDLSRADVLYNMAFGMNALDNIDSAIVLLEAVIVITPDSPDALYNLGAFRIKKAAAFNKSSNMYRDSLEVNETKYQPVIDSIDAIVREIYQRAAKEFEQVVALQPDNKDALVWLAEAYYTLEEWGKSEELYKKIVEQFPDHEEAWCMLVIINLKLNDKAGIEAAKKHCPRYQ